MAVLRVQNVSKTFPARRRGQGPVTALGDLSFELESKSFGSLVGPSGCGKSTFLNIVSGVETTTSGRIDLIPDEGENARIGYVFQDPRLLPWKTVMDNLLYVHDEPRKEVRPKLERYLEMVGLAHAAKMYPRELSGGMQQRVGIARAFSVEPDLLLMDEPFSHLDALTARELRVHLEALWQETKKTVLFVTHDIAEAVQLSDRIVVLAPGGRMHSNVDVDLARPRRVTDPEFATLQAKLLQQFEGMARGASNDDADLATV